MPIPLPKSYVQGLDLQKRDFEDGRKSYLFGNWSDHGWWYYYLVCAAFKVPLGFWTLAMSATFVKARHVARAAVRRRCVGIVGLNEATLLLPAIAVFALVSSQSGFSRYFRYVLPAAPFLFIWVSHVARPARRNCGRAAIGIACAVAWTVASSIWMYPHSMSYFNELAGGPIGGSRYLLDANIDWGQDTLYLRDWCARHPAATPMRTFWRVGSAGWPEKGEGAGSSRPEKGVPMIETYHAPLGTGLRPGWYAASVHELRDRGNICHCLLGLSPVARAGYSICIYHLSAGDISRLGNASGAKRGFDR